MVKDTGINSGVYDYYEYTTAALASETRDLAVPASADSTPLHWDGRGPCKHEVSISGREKP